MGIDRFPRWLWPSAFLLAANGGYLNGSVFLYGGFLGVSHMSGNVTQLTLKLFRGDQAGIVLLLTGLILGYFLGAVLSGIIVRDEHFRIGRRYGFSLFVESLFLYLAFHFIISVPVIGFSILAAALGLQNAMVTTFSGSIIRTTHMTGILTDFGADIGNRIAGRPVPWKVSLLQSILLTGFVTGNGLSWWSRNLEGTNFLIPSIGSTFLMGILYLVFIRKIFQKQH